MSETIVSKKCCTCKEIKPLSAFHKSRIAKDGHQSVCKICQKQYRQTEKGKAGSRKALHKYRRSAKGTIKQQQYRQSEKGKVLNNSAVKKYHQTEKGRRVQRRNRRKHETLNPEEKKAQHAVFAAVRCGKLPAVKILTCKCGKQAEEYHHPSYAKEHWLDVVPLCYKCHCKLRNHH